VIGITGRLTLVASWTISSADKKFRDLKIFTNDTFVATRRDKDTATLRPIYDIAFDAATADGFGKLLTDHILDNSNPNESPVVVTLTLFVEVSDKDSPVKRRFQTEPVEIKVGHKK
jgi:hypothetical protein